MTREKKKKLLKEIYWDYKVSPAVLLEKIEGKRQWIDEAERNRTFVRCFESLKWEQTVNIWTIEQCLKLLDNKDVEKSIRREQRARFEYLKEFLVYGKPVSPPEQNFECIKRIIPILVSNRWYGIK